MGVFPDIVESIGKTPLVKLKRLTRDLPVNFLVKIEGRNPSYSVKCRIGAAMIAAAEAAGQLSPGMQVIEPTSGNTGIALAFVCAAKGYPLTLLMPETMSAERRRMLRGFGAQLLLTPADEGMKGALRRAEQLARTPGHYMPQQFQNPANPQVHWQTTGPEIWNDTDGRVDILVAGVGTGGTITGVSRYFEQTRGKSLHSVAVEPAESAVLSGGAPNAHRIQGIGAGFVPANLDRSFVDEVFPVSSDDAFEMSRRIARDEGITCGISSGAALHAALQIANRPEASGKTIVVILPDSGERYLSTKIYGE